MKASLVETRSATSGLAAIQSSVTRTIKAFEEFGRTVGRIATVKKAKRK